MEWSKLLLLNTKRQGNRDPKQELGRSPFNSDHDKIIFSGAFRRLAKKTQVHPLATNDHVHNRLTHSLEVACVGRSLGIKVGHALKDKNHLPTEFVPTDLGDIVQSACLAHDIGNPPFGHTGEEAIRNWFSSDGNKYLEKLTPDQKNDLLHFEGNAQGLRVLTSSEYHPNDGGMRLTYATLASFIKYPWTSMACVSKDCRPKDNKYGVFQSELKIFEEIASAVGLEKQSGEHWYCRHPLVYLMEAADDFCYGILDLEDGLEMDILKWEDIYQILKPVLDASQVTDLESDFSNVCNRGKPAIIRGKVISAYIDAAATAFIENEQKFLNGEIEGDLISLCPDNIKNSVTDAKNTSKEKIFKHPRKVELEIGSYYVISTLLEIMCAAAEEWVKNPDKLSYKSKRVIDLIGKNTFDFIKSSSEQQPDTRNYLAIMRVIDFISGMTDHYATYLAKQFNGMGQSR